MKSILIFIGLKVGEIAGFGLICYLLCLLGRFIDKILFPGTSSEPFWFYGLLAICFIGVIFGIIFLIAMLVIENWEWAKRLSNRNK